MWTSLAQIIGVVVSIASLVFAIVTQVRTSSQRKHAELAETAARLLTSLESISVGGISPKLDDTLALKLHDEQIHGLRELVRLNIAEFERRAKRRGLSLYLHSIIGVYGLLVLWIAFGMTSGLPRIRADQQWLAYVIVAGVFILGGAMVLDLILAVARRVRGRSIRRKAGLYVQSELEVLTKAYLQFRAWRRGRRDAVSSGRQRSVGPPAADAE
jgi:hypothetical protein